MKEAILDAVLSGWGSTIILGMLSAFLGKAFKKYKDFAKELLDVAVKYNQVTDEKSPGGKSMTKEEKDEFVKEILEVIQRIPSLFGKKEK